MAANYQSEGTVRRAVSQLERTMGSAVSPLDERSSKGIKMLDLKKIQKYEVDVTLDPDTAHPGLNLSDDRKQVSHSYVTKEVPDNPGRFSNYNKYVLAKQSVSSGRFYYEVQVQQKTGWILGVAGSIDRKEDISWMPCDGIWTIELTNGNEYSSNGDPPVRLSLKSQPQKVGVFVDYEAGLVSFYDVEVPALIYSFTGCSFTGKLFPFFYPGINDGENIPLIISPVRRNQSFIS